MAGYNPVLVPFGMSSKIDEGETGGTRNYDKLHNKPIENVVGSDEQPIDIAALEPGRYSLTGRYNVGGETKTADAPIEIVVADKNGERLAYYIELTHFDLTVHLLRFKDGALLAERTQSLLGDSFENM